MNKAEAWFRIVRPPIVIISIFGACVGALNVTQPRDMALEPISLFLTMLGAGMLAAGLMVHNDYTDLESDRVNRPHKPLPRNIISPLTAKYTGLALMVLTIVITLLISFINPIESTLTPWGLNLPLIVLTIAVVVIGVIYNQSGKYSGIWGHVMVAFGVGAIPLWGALALQPQHPLLMAPLAFAIFVMEIGREIMVCAGDIKGDIEAGYKTTPVRVGRLESMHIALIFYVLFIPVYPIPYFGWFGFSEIFGELYLWGASIFLLILLLTWVDTYRVAVKKNDKNTWDAFERNIRTGTRLGVFFFQVVLFFEAFYF
ncbi:MAG: UbiA family prenyltransferase [Thermoplasmata archaeon]|nr:MAG: UbiA family prenyltransferase [Thermoplasmata archaeon]